jgi:hypothetical protein
VLLALKLGALVSAVFFAAPLVNDCDGRTCLGARSESTLHGSWYEPSIRSEILTAKRGNASRWPRQASPVSVESDFDAD